MDEHDGPVGGGVEVAVGRPGVRGDGVGGGAGGFPPLLVDAILGAVARRAHGHADVQPGLERRQRRAGGLGRAEPLAGGGVERRVRSGGESVGGEFGDQFGAGVVGGQHRQAAPSLPHGLPVGGTLPGPGGRGVQVNARCAQAVEPGLPHPLPPGVQRNDLGGVGLVALDPDDRAGRRDVRLPPLPDVRHGLADDFLDLAVVERGVGLGVDLPAQVQRLVRRQGKILDEGTGAGEQLRVALALVGRLEAVGVGGGPAQENITVGVGSSRRFFADDAQVSSSRRLRLRGVLGGWERGQAALDVGEGVASARVGLVDVARGVLVDVPEAGDAHDAGRVMHRLVRSEQVDQPLLQVGPERQVGDRHFEPPVEMHALAGHHDHGRRRQACEGQPHQGGCDGDILDVHEQAAGEQHAAVLRAALGDPGVRGGVDVERDAGQHGHVRPALHVPLSDAPPRRRTPVHHGQRVHGELDVLGELPAEEAVAKCRLVRHEPERRVGVGDGP